LDRKRHIGNDIVNIVFFDGSLEETSLFQPQFIKSHFTHIYAVVCYQVPGSGPDVLPQKLPFLTPNNAKLFDYNIGF
jgi:prepilin-type processing-associated H-X9-DG protein